MTICLTAVLPVCTRCGIRVYRIASNARIADADEHVMTRTTKSVE
jgi:hypothetical protein